MTEKAVSTPSVIFLFIKYSESFFIFCLYIGDKFIPKFDKNSSILLDTYPLSSIAVELIGKESSTLYDAVTSCIEPS